MKYDELFAQFAMHAPQEIPDWFVCGEPLPPAIATPQEIICDYNLFVFFWGPFGDEMDGKAESFLKRYDRVPMPGRNSFMPENKPIAEKFVADIVSRNNEYNRIEKENRVNRSFEWRYYYASKMILKLREKEGGKP